MIKLSEIFAILFRNKLLIAVVTTTVMLGTVLWVATRTPEYSAQATLLLEKGESAGGVLSELASLTSDPQAEAEIVLLKSRSLATVTANAPRVWNPDGRMFSATAPDFDPFAKVEASAANFDMSAAGDPSAMENLGLLWQVDSHDLMPFAGYVSGLPMGAGKHRLFARLDPIGGELYEGGPAEYDIQFSDADAEGGQTVAISTHTGFLSPNDVDAQVFDYTPNALLQAFGWQFQLLATGEFSGQRYRLRRVSQESAINGLMGKVSARESGRKTNVVLVTVTDSDPYRAAETANALCKNYIRRSVRIGQQKANQTATFIESQLVEQLEQLKLVEEKVVKLQTENPETIAVSASASALIEQAAKLELQMTQIDLAKRVIEEALGYLDQGEFEALARLGGEMPNLIALGYIKELTALEVESLRLDRSDVLGYKMLLQTERMRVQGLEEESSLRMSSLQGGLEALREGDAAAIARVAAGSEFNSYLAEIASIDGELSRARGSSTEDSQIVRSLSAARKELLGSLTEQVSSALAGAAEANQNYKQLGETYADTLAKWPEEERSTIAVAVKQLRMRLRSNLKSQVEGIQNTMGIVQDQADEVKARLGALPEGELALAEPMRERVARTKIVEFLLSSKQQATITAASTSASAVLIDPAVPIRSRIFPRVTLFLLTGTLMGFLAGCGLALVHNFLRGALHTEADVERAAGVPVLGSVPNYLIGRTKIKGAKRGIRFLPMRDKPESPQAEAYRQIRASLRMAMSDGVSLKSIACTSCIPGEGKTVTNADLAMVFAGAGERVLLVDCDLRKPQVHKIFEVERGPGFGDVLEGRSEWRDCVNRSLSNNVDVLPAGSCTGRPGELLASELAKPIIEQLTEEYDLVVFDLPPAVVVADVANFASKLDALILLYRSGGVDGRMVSATASRLRRAGVNLIGVIVNAVVIQSTPGGYGYSYEESYHDHADESDK